MLQVLERAKNSANIRRRVDILCLNNYTATPLDDVAGYRQQRRIELAATESKRIVVLV
jgi:hypothetical protein